MILIHDKLVNIIVTTGALNKLGRFLVSDTEDMSCGELLKTDSEDQDNDSKISGNSIIPSSTFSPEISTIHRKENRIDLDPLQKIENNPSQLCSKTCPMQTLVPFTKPDSPVMCAQESGSVQLMSAVLKSGLWSSRGSYATVQAVLMASNMTTQQVLITFSIYF